MGMFAELVEQHWLTLVLLAIAVALLYRENRPDVTGTPKARFRNREKILFYGRKMLRRVSSFAKNNIVSSSGGRRGRESRKKKLVISIARKILRLKKEQEPQWKAREPPPSLLEVDWHELEYEYRLPAELLYMLRNVRVLGHFEKPIFLELCRFMESRFIPAGTHLFKIGDPDDSIYVIQSGTVNVYITEPDGKEFCVKEVSKGESIHSLLSILDVLTGHPSPYKTVSAAAVSDSTILRLPAHAFQIVLERFPESMVRVIQIIMIRLQRVTFMALHNYLGLSHELINPENPADKNFLVHTIASHLKTSPVHSTIPVEGRVAPAGAENEAAMKPPAVPVTPLEDDAIGYFVAEPTEAKRKTVSRKTSESTGKTRIDVEQPASDFAAACSRARVGGSLLDDDHLLSLSPPVQSSDEYSSLVGTPTRKIRKAVLTDTRSIIPPIPPSTLAAKEQLDDSQILDMATQDIASLLGLRDVNQLRGKCKLLSRYNGTILIKQGDQESHLYFVVTGMLEVQQQMVGNESEQRTMYRVCPGELVGTLAVLTGEPSFFTIRVLVDARLIYIAKNDFYLIMKEQPKVVLNVGHTVVQRMSGFVRQIDFALDWMLIEAGRALYRQGEQSDCVYIILNGRLRSVVQLPTGKKELVGEYGRGELVGLVEVLTQTDRSTTMMAVRDTELAQIPDELLNLIKRKFPQIVTRLIHLLGQRILGSLGNRANAYAVLSEHPNVEPRPTVANLATVAVLPVSDKVPLSNFTLELQHALNGIGPTLRLNSEIVQNKLGSAAFDSINEYRLSSWLGQQEDIHRMVLYQCDIRMTPWTQRCIRQADCVLILALANQDPAVGQLEKQLDNMAVRAQKELILLHRQDGPNLKNTVEWLNLREWCSSHHHIRCHKRVFSRKPQAKIMETYQKVLECEPDRMSDFSRLARFLTGTAVGLVLGGGGARGCSHVGIIRALNEARIPIDFIGGTSIGSFMGALWAEETNFTRFKQRAREWCKDMNCLWKKLFDLTYPITAMFSGASFNRTIESVFHDRQIEDLWIPYFCITTDLTASKMRVHTHGSLWRAIRGSMTIAGYLPPLCHPQDGHLLVDGGYVNNLPADVMKVMGVQTTFAIDVGSQDETDLTNYGDELSGWWLLWQKWYPWAKPIKIPNLVEVLERISYVSSANHVEQIKLSRSCEYMRPPIDNYHTMEFGKFDEIYEVGYAHGKTLLVEWEKTGRIKDLFTEKHCESTPTVNKNVMPQAFKFMDLAKLISQIPNPNNTNTGGTASRIDGTNFYTPESEGVTDEEDKIYATSEPIVSLNSPVVCSKRAASEGALPESANDEDDDEEVIKPQDATFDSMDNTEEGSVSRSSLQRLGNLDKDLIWKLITSANKHNDLTETPLSPPKEPDSYHVCLPCYHHKGTKDRWKTIRHGFHDIIDGYVTSGDELKDLILSYNGKYKHEWDFDGLLNYCSVMSRSKWSDICATLRKMADHALNIEKFVKMPIPFLKKGMNASFALSKKQIACLLAHAFFCTFPIRNADSSDAFPLPSINFSSLFKSSDTGSRNSKLNCIFHYFNRVLNRMPSGKVVFKRQSLTDSIKWSKSKTHFTELYVSADGTIESENGLLQVDFANKYIGGGVLGRGCVQEEIMFMVAPELIVSRLFTEVLEDDEVLIMTGSEIYSRHKGYSDTFEWTGNYVDKTTSVNGVKLTQIVAMDALSFDRPNEQYKVTEIDRELNKAYSGFFSECKGRVGVRLPAVSTGNWGCGAFGGDKHLKSLIQMMAAAEASRDLCYFTYGDKELVQKMSKAHELIRQNNLTVGDVYHIVMDYIKNLKTQRNYSSPKLYDYLLRPKGT